MDTYEDLLRVWTRVHPSPGEPGDPDEPEGPDRAVLALRRTMDSLSGAAAEYSRLADRTGGRVRQTLADLASQERALERQLQAEHFLATGDTYAPERGKRGRGSLLSSLRELHNAELRLAARLETEPLPVLRGQAERHRLHARAVRELIDRLIG